MALSVENRTDFVRNIVKLSLWLVRKYQADGVEFERAVNRGTPIYRLTSLWDGVHHPANPIKGWNDKKWDALLKILKEESEVLTDNSSFERKGLETLWPWLEKRIEKDVNDWPWIPSAFGTKIIGERVSGMFLYEITEDGKLDLHMGNIYTPESPFKDMTRMAVDLRDLVENVIKKNSDIKSVVCESWMNSFEPFLTLFPIEWCKKSEATDMFNYTYDIWGQMVNRYGGFHKKNGEYLRIHGNFPYLSKKCECRIDSLLNHLKNNLKH